MGTQPRRCTSPSICATWARLLADVHRGQVQQGHLARTTPGHDRPSDHCPRRCQTTCLPPSICEAASTCQPLDSKDPMLERVSHHVLVAGRDESTMERAPWPHAEPSQVPSARSCLALKPSVPHPSWVVGRTAECSAQPVLYVNRARCVRLILVASQGRPSLSCVLIRHSSLVGVDRDATVDAAFRSFCTRQIATVKQLPPASKTTTRDQRRDHRERVLVLECVLTSVRPLTIVCSLSLSKVSSVSVSVSVCGCTRLRACGLTAI